MEKRAFQGITMEVTRYNSSKDMMRRGMASATSVVLSLNGYSQNDSYCSTYENYFSRSRKLGHAGFTGRLNISVP